MVEKSGEATLERLRELEHRLSISHDAIIGDIGLAGEVFEASLDGIVIASSSGVILLINRMAAAMFEYEPADLLGQNISKLIPENYRARHEAKQDEYFEHPHVRVFNDLEGLKKNGETFPVSIALHPLLSHTGTIVMATLREVHGGSPN